MKLNKKLFLLFLLIFNLKAIEFNDPILLARSNVRDSYNLPPLTYLTNIAPVINNNGDIAFKVVSTGENGVQGIWIKANYDHAGKVIFLAPEEMVVTDPSINDQGKIAFSLFDETSSDGVFVIDLHSLKLDQVIDAAKNKLTYYTYPTINNQNKIFFRGTNSNNDRSFYSFEKNISSLVNEGDKVLGLPASYLFRPSVNDLGMIAYKMRMGTKGNWDESNPDFIATFDPSKNESENIKIVASDFDYDKNSKFISFFNSPGLSNVGHVAFSAVTADRRVGVYLSYPNGELKNIALENEDDVLNVETYPIKVNSKGHVLFRGRDKELKRCLFYFDGQKIIKVIREGDEVASDKGPAKILDNQHFPGFIGEVDLNEADQIIFGVMILNAKDNQEWGAGVYLINPKN